MSGGSAYVRSWRQLVSRGIRSYVDVADRLMAEEERRRAGSTESPDEAYAGKRGLRIEIPLLWGTF